MAFSPHHGVADIDGTGSSSAPPSHPHSAEESGGDDFHAATQPPSVPSKTDMSSYTESTASTSSWAPSSSSSTPSPYPSAPSSAVRLQQPGQVEQPLRRPLPPVRKRKKLPGGLDTPKSILKPAPPPQKPFSFRRDILQSLNTRLAQQGVNVQVPLPPGGAAQGAANLLGGVLKRLGGIAGAALAPSNIETATNYDDQSEITNAAGSQHQPSPATASLQDIASRSQPTQLQQYLNPASSPPPDLLNSSTTNGSAISSTSGLPVPSSSAKPLRRVQFTVSKMSVIYPISGAIAPGDEDDTRKRIEASHRQALKDRKEKAWTPQELEALYRQCCRIREEFPLKKMRLVFEEAAQQDPPRLKTLDLSFLPLDRQAIDPLADFLSVDFGLDKLVLENCGLNDDGVKALLHALLLSGTLTTLSLASNRKIKYQGWRYVAIFMRRARLLRYLDLSENPINRASLEHLAEAIRRSEAEVTRRPKEKGQESNATETSPQGVESPSTSYDENEEDGEPLMPPAALLRHVANEDAAPLTSAIISLRLENCGLKGAPLNLIGQAVRTSDVKHLSLRRNRINQVGAVAVAVMLKDYPEGASVVGEQRKTSHAVEGGEGDDKGLERNSRLPTPRTVPAQRGYSPLPLDGPVITSSPAGGMTARRMPTDEVGSAANVETLDIDRRLSQSEEETIRMTKDPALTEAEAVALYQAKRARKILAGLPRVGNLLTLDLKSNDIRGGVAYLAQVLRKNRTLKVLNLSDNGIEMGGLVALAEALKYNSTLETLDLSHNPCSGPGLEGITTLRTAFAVNSNLRRLFLNDTDLSSAGAIALAEFLPEARSLIHLDLTENFDIDIAGVMALTVSLKLNKSLRCLDLNIPPNDRDFARLSQEILQSCVRNTESAQKKATQKGLKQPIAAPIYKSVVARAAKEKDERQKTVAASKAAEGTPVAGYNSLVAAARECELVLRDLVKGEEKRKRSGVEMTEHFSPAVPSRELVEDLIGQAQKIRSKLTKAVGHMEEGDLLAEALQVNDELELVAGRLHTLRLDSAFASNARSPTIDKNSRGQAAASSIVGDSTSPPTFLIGDGQDDEDEDDDDEPGPMDASCSSHLDLDRGEEASLALVAEKEEDMDTLQTNEEPDSPGEIKAKSMGDEEGEVFRRARSLRVGEEVEEEDAEGTEAVKETSTDVPRANHTSSPIGPDLSSSSSLQETLAVPSSSSLPIAEEGENSTSSRSPTYPRGRASTSSLNSINGSLGSDHSTSSTSTTSSANASASTSRSTLALLKGKGVAGEEEEEEEEERDVEDLPGEELRKRLLQADVPVPARGVSPKGGM